MAEGQINLQEWNSFCIFVFKCHFLRGYAEEVIKTPRYMKEVSNKKLIETIIEGIQNRKGQRIVSIDLRKIKEAPVDYMIIAEGTSNIQVGAIADEVDDACSPAGGSRSRECGMGGAGLRKHLRAHHAT